jgi:hypothetical protein
LRVIDLGNARQIIERQRAALSACGYHRGRHASQED